jgi:hypothetical protein
MLASTMVAMTEMTLLGLEARRVIALRMQVLMLGGVNALSAADLMVNERKAACRKASSDLSAGASHAGVRSDLRPLVQGNIARLTAPTSHQ